MLGLETRTAAAGLAISPVQHLQPMTGFDQLSAPISLLTGRSLVDGAHF
jgi:hypothetical protein